MWNMTEQNAQPEEKKIPTTDLVPWADFLEGYPINSVQKVSGYYERKKGTQVLNPYVRLAPVLRIHCPNCQGIRNFAGHWVHHPEFRDGDFVWDFLDYTCKDCDEGSKTFCVASQMIDENGNGLAVKIGEFPELYLELPRSMEKLFGKRYCQMLCMRISPSASSVA